MLPTLQPLSESDKTLIDVISHQVYQLNCFHKVGEIIQPFVSDYDAQIITQSKLNKVLNKLGNATFIYVANRIRQLPEVNSLIMRRAFSQWMESIDQCKVRFVWILVEKHGQITLLSKGPQFHQSVSNCLKTGWEFQPTIDYPDSLAFQLLTFEIQQKCEFVLNNTIKDRKSSCQCSSSQQERTIIFNDVRYTYDMIHGTIIVKLPWFVCAKAGKSLFVFYIKREDQWIYSEDGNIRAVYKELEKK